MSFKTFLERWANDSKSTKAEAAITYKVTPPNTFSECEVLHMGVKATDNTQLDETNMCWLRSPLNELKCCYWLNNAFHEFSFKQLDGIFGPRIRDSQYCIDNNERILPNGIRVPVVPLEFIEQLEGKDRKKKRRKLEKTRIRKQYLSHVNTIIWFFYTASAPSLDECFDPPLLHPPRIFSRDPKTLPKNKDGVIVEPPSTSSTKVGSEYNAIMEVLESTRTIIAKHPLYATQLNKCCLTSVKTMDDLVQLTIKDNNGKDVSIGSEIISVYNFLFPKDI